jgi:hypothetical protein
MFFTLVLRGFLNFFYTISSSHNSMLSYTLNLAKTRF